MLALFVDAIIMTLIKLLVIGSSCSYGYLIASLSNCPNDAISSTYLHEQRVGQVETPSFVIFAELG